MRTRDKFPVGAIAGAGLALGARELVRARKRTDLDGRVVIITGASTGHGLIAARDAAGRGARLVIAARHIEELNAAEADLACGEAHDVMAVATDVTDRYQCQRLVDRAIERHGRVDVLVNNAGVIQVGPMETMTLENFELAIATNFWGALYCTLAVLSHMRSRQFGRIVNVDSVGGKMPVPHLRPYTTSKFALSGLTKALRVELAKDGILVTGVYPSTMRTGGHTHAWVKSDKQAEYSMLALSDTLPLVSTSAERMPRSLWRAACDGDAEVNVGWQARGAAAQLECRQHGPDRRLAPPRPGPRHGGPRRGRPRLGPRPPEPRGAPGDSPGGPGLSLRGRSHRRGGRSASEDPPPGHPTRADALSRAGCPTSRPGNSRHVRVIHPLQVFITQGGFR